MDAGVRSASAINREGKRDKEIKGGRRERSVRETQGKGERDAGKG